MLNLTPIPTPEPKPKPDPLRLRRVNPRAPRRVYEDGVRAGAVRHMPKEREQHLTALQRALEIAEYELTKGWVELLNLTYVLPVDWFQVCSVMEARLAAQRELSLSLANLNSHNPAPREPNPGKP